MDLTRDVQPCRSDVGAVAAVELLAVLADPAPEALACPRCGWAIGVHDFRRIGGDR